MNRTWKIGLVALLTVLLISITWFFVRNEEENLPEETSQIEICDSCTARHQNLTRLRDARSSAPRADE